MNLEKIARPFLKGMILVGVTFSTSFIFAQKKTARTVSAFEDNWKFVKEDKAGAENPGFNDEGWRSLSVPHDWSIEGAYDRNNTTGRGGGYLPSGIGWYRKAFTIPKAQANKKIFIEFDGIMANSDVWVNGKHLGHRPNGYLGIRYDLTPHLIAGKPNVIAVKADNSLQPASRWYTGGGIYRHVRLIAMNPVHVANWGVFVTAKDITEQSATVNVKTDIQNESASRQSIILETTLISPNGKSIKTEKSTQVIDAGASITIEQTMAVPNPQLWDIEKVNLYTTETKILSGKTLLDEETTRFGIRDFHFDAATGFYLNGKNFKIKGVCLHHDGGSVGAAVPLAIWRKRLLTLKELGVNGIRTAHNPMAPEFYELCDELGFLVMDESFDTWRAKKANGENGYNLYFDKWWETDTRDMVMRDRNHPSIIIYSVGNEIRDDLDSPAGFKTFTDQRDLINQLDGTRPVTMALFRPNSAKVYDNGFVELMDVVGQNYRESELVQAHLSNPKRKVLGTENGHTIDAWLKLRDNPFMAGQFLWTGIDYLGEANWPAIGSNQGIMERTGIIKPRGYQRQSWWTEKPMVHIARNDKAGSDGFVSNWTPIDLNTNGETRVQVYSNCEEVELFLNGKSLGSKPLPENASPFTWTVDFAPGTIKAVGKNSGKIVSEHELRTAGAPVRIILTTDQKELMNSFDDAAVVTATIVDENGIVCPNVDKSIKFEVTKEGVLNALDNGNILSTESYKSSERYAYNGKVTAVIQSNAPKGIVTIKASAEGLLPGSISLQIKK